MANQARRQIQVGYLDKMGDEQFFYLEFDTNEHVFYYAIERISRTGETSRGSWPLHEAKGERGYRRAIEWIEKSCFSVDRVPG